MTTEAQRAAVWRANQALMERQRAAIERSLAGSTAARQALENDYEPIVGWLAERNTTDGGDPEGDKDGQLANG